MKMLLNKEYKSDSKFDLIRYYPMCEQFMKLLLDLSDYYPPSEALYLLKVATMVDNNNKPYNALSDIIHAV